MSSLVLPANGIRNGSTGHAAYAPKEHPERMAALTDATSQAIDEIGEDVARAIGQTRKKLRKEFETADAKLAELEEAIRGHTQIAQTNVSAFICRATDVREGVVELLQQMKPAQASGDRSPQQQPSDEH